jgi:hypothetical protein
MDPIGRSLVGHLTRLLAENFREAEKSKRIVKVAGV